MKTNQTKPKESWEQKFERLYDSEVRRGVVCGSYSSQSIHRGSMFVSSRLKQFIAKTLKEHDEKLVAEMEKEKENGYPLPDDYYDKTKIIGEQRAEAWNNAIDRAIEIVRGGEK